MDFKYNISKKDFAFSSDFIINYFKSYNLESSKIDGSVYRGVDLSVFNFCFNHLLRADYIDRKKHFIHTGSGYGQIPLLVASYYNMFSIGIEADEGYSNKSFGNKSFFFRRRFLPKQMLRLINGDFSKIETYEKGFIKIENIGTFFNFNNKVHSLVELMNLYSPPDTNLIFAGFNHAYTFDGFDHILSFKNNKETMVSFSLTSFKESEFKFDPDILYIHLYKKYN